MSSESPGAILYDTNGNLLPVQNATIIPSNTPGIISLGSDGTNSRYISVDTSGRLIVVGAGVAGTPAGGVLTIQGVSGGTAVTVNNGTAANLLANIGGLAAAGSASSGNPVWVAGNVTTAAPTYANNTVNALSITTGGLLRVDGVYPINATTPTTDAMFVAGAVTTAAPTYTTGQMSALSLTTAGALRVDGSAVTQPVSGTVTANQGTANTLANAWSMKITDATNGPAAVKAPSTAAVAADPALVVAISPNNPISVGGVADATATGALGALNAAVSLTLAGHNSTGFELAAGTLIGTILAEVSYDGGTTWNPTYVDNTNGNKVSSIVFASANTATGATIVGAGGSGTIRIRVSAYTSGTANITIRASAINDPSVLFAGTAGATVLPPTIAQSGGSVTTSSPTYTTGTLNALSLDTTGNLRINMPDGVASGALGALNATVAVALSGHTGAGMQLSAGTLIGTIVPEMSFDGGTTWIATAFTDPTTDLNAASIVFASANTATAQSINLSGGITNVRVRVSAFTSGTANITVRATNAYSDNLDFSGVPGSAAPTNVAFVGGAVTTAAPTYTNNTSNALSLTTAGALRVDASGAHIKGTIQPLYGTSGQTVTITLASQASAAARASTAIDNTSNLYEDVLLFIKYTAGTGVSATGYVNVYGYGTVDGGTTYPEGITGTDATVTLTSPPNLVLIAQVNVNSTTTKTFGPFSFCRMYGLDKLPAKWGVVVVNNTGAAANATAGNFAVTYQGVNGQLV